MIRLTALLRRNPELSSGEFHTRWRDTHAELVRSLPDAGHRILRYEQHPRLAEPDRWTGSEGFEGMAVQWYDRLADLEAMVAGEAYRRTVAPDERALVDLERSVYLVTREPRVIIGSDP